VASTWAEVETWAQQVASISVVGLLVVGMEWRVLGNHSRT